ncbi:hypothetical protein C798_18195 [Herbaspirillum rubrisubalbicans Os34]|uniref:H-type lectin domain-containing protein n=1 Tax=Herbaspirillum rubrisubalbicans Os34 TaxID=1235827 RepID=A0A6M3ZUR9_9BURK|nr:hypothetical protein [Herbaspirillum rubrisubalbicans]QJQ02091.1 hypothetical protein C798_18195 [Herbaspirillum rubrisubalbicans Os34]
MGKYAVSMLLALALAACNNNVATKQDVEDLQKKLDLAQKSAVEKFAIVDKRLTAIETQLVAVTPSDSTIVNSGGSFISEPQWLENKEMNYRCSPAAPVKGRNGIAMYGLYRVHKLFTTPYKKAEPTIILSTPYMYKPSTLEARAENVTKEGFDLTVLSSCNPSEHVTSVQVTWLAVGT